MKKKLLALLLSAAMLLGLAVPTFADGEPEGYSLDSSTATATVTTVEALQHAEEQPTVDSIVINDNIVIDEHLTVTKNLTISEGVTVTMAVPEDNFGKLEIRCGELAADTTGGPTLTNNGTIDGDGALWLYWPCAYTGSGALEVSEKCRVEFRNYLLDAQNTSIHNKCYANGSFEANNFALVCAVNTSDGFIAAAGVQNAAILVTDAFYHYGQDENRCVLSLNPTTTDTITLSDSLMTEMPLSVESGKTLQLADRFNSFDDTLIINGTLSVNSTEYRNTQLNGNVEVQPGGMLRNEPGSRLIINSSRVEIRKDDTNGAGVLENMGKLLCFAGGEGNGINIFGELRNNGRLENCGNMFVNGGGRLEIYDADKAITYDPNATDNNGNWLGWETAEDHVMFNRDGAFLQIRPSGVLNVGGALHNKGRIGIFGGTMNVLASAKGDNTVEGVINGAVKSFGEINVNGGSLYIEDAYAADASKGLTAHPYAAVVVNIGNVNVSYNDAENVKRGGEVIVNGLFYNYARFGLSGKDSGSDGNDQGRVTVNGGSNDQDPYGFKNYGELFINRNGYFEVNGTMLNGRDNEMYGRLYVNGGGTFDIKDGGELCNQATQLELNGGSLWVRGYLWNRQGRLQLNDGFLQVKSTENQNYTTDGTTAAAPESGVLCNEGEININNSAKLEVLPGETDHPYSGLLRNHHTILINGGRLEVQGILDNDGNVKNNGEFLVKGADARIYNHGYLRVGDSATFSGKTETAAYGTLGSDGRYEEIVWENATAKDNLVDDFVFRIWNVNGGRYRTPSADLNHSRYSNYWGLIVMGGQDYFGGWKNARDKVNDGEIESFRVVSSHPDIISVGDDNGDYDTFTLYYKDWGSTTLQILVDDSVNGEQNETERRSYNANVCLNYLDFYTERRLDDSGMWIDATTAMQFNEAIPGSGYSYNIGDRLWLMRSDEGFDNSVFNTESYDLKIWYQNNQGGGTATVSEPDGEGWRTVTGTDGTEFFRLKPVERGSSNHYDIEFEFIGGDLSYDIVGSICGTNFYSIFNKPTVYVEDAAVPAGAGHTVTVEVKASDVNSLGGYDLTLAYDNTKLTYVSCEMGKDMDDSALFYVNGTIAPQADAQNAGVSTIRIPAVVCDANGLYCSDTTLFTLTFTTTAANVPDAAIRFVGSSNQLCNTDNRPKVINAALRDGAVQTFIPGDVLRDGTVDIRDAVRLLRASAKLCDLSKAEYQAALLVENDPAHGPSVNGVLAILKYLADGTALTYYPSTN